MGPQERTRWVRKVFAISIMFMVTTARLSGQNVLHLKTPNMLYFNVNNLRMAEGEGKAFAQIESERWVTYIE